MYIWHNKDKHTGGAKMTVDQNPLTNLNAKIAAHWEEHRPKMTKRLKATGQFEKAVEAATVLTEEAVITYKPKNAGNMGMVFWQAWELFRNEWAFLPTEEDVPVLGSDPATWEAPEIPDEDEDLV
jgi:hypothetical protein